MRGWRSRTTRSSPISTGFAPFSTTGQSSSTHAATRHMSSSTRCSTDDVPRSAIQHRLPFRRVLPVGARPGGPRPSGPGDALLRRAMQRSRDSGSSRHDIGFVYYRWQAGLRSGREWFQRRRMPGAATGWSRWRRSRWHRAATGSSRLHLGAILLAVEGERPGCAAEAARRLQQLDAIEQIAARRSSSKRTRESRATGRSAAAWEDTSAPASCGEVPTGPPGDPYGSIGGASPWSPNVADLSRLPERRAGACRRRRAVRARRRQLSERLHLPAAAERVGRLARLALPVLRRRSPGTRTSP